MNLLNLKYPIAYLLLIAMPVISACGGGGGSSSSNVPPAGSYSLILNNTGLGTLSAFPRQSEYPSGTAVILTATPAEGYAFSSWSGDLSGSQNPVSVVMNGDKSINAIFERTYYSLTLDATANGSVSATPLLTQYPAGSTVVLTATPASGFGFSSWTGSLSGGQSPVALRMDGNKSIGAAFVAVSTDDYFVDYENGDDSNDGRSTITAWKHAPGDALATLNPATVTLGAGSRVLFRGETKYRGQITVQSGGAQGFPITYRGDAWPGLEGRKAIIDGGEPIPNAWTRCTSAAECGGSPLYANLWYSYVDSVLDPLGLNLHEYNATLLTDEFVWPSQTPNPTDVYFFDNHDDFIEVYSETYTGTRDPALGTLTRTSLSDALRFNQTDANHWTDSYLLIWTNPNSVATRKIQSFNPSTHTVTFDDLGANALYTDRPQSYAIFNSIHAIDTPGEYHAAITADNRTKVVIWPRSTTDLANRISYSVRNWGFDLRNRSNITIEGLSIMKHAGFGLRDGIGIGTINNTTDTNYNVTIKNNYISHNRKGGGGGYGGIYLSNSVNTLVEGNELIDNPENAGIFFSAGSQITARNNIIERSGATSLRLYTISDAVIAGNDIRKSQGGHANGITIYMGSRNILVANNRITESDSPITFQDSGNLWYINNIVDAGGRAYNVNEWPDTSRGPWARGTIVFVHNTLVNNPNNVALNVGRNNTEKVVDMTVYPANTYVSANNIIDGDGYLDDNTSVLRRNNLYTGLSRKQFLAQTLNEGELLEENLAAIFSDQTTFQLKAGSPAINSGLDIAPYFPTSTFPTFDFTRDIDGTIRTGRDLGAYDYP